MDIWEILIRENYNVHTIIAGIPVFEILVCRYETYRLRAEVIQRPAAALMSERPVVPQRPQRPASPTVQAWKWAKEAWR